jgi:hypothetical protein
MVETSPLFCISIRCLTHHKKNDKYICDSIHKGYILDFTGEFCMCKAGYIAVEIDPLICVSAR